MIREEHSRQLSNEQLETLLQRLSKATEFLRDLANIGDMYVEAGRTTIVTRQSAKQGRKTLDFGEFFEYLKQRNADAAHILGKAQIIKFDWGRIHIRFPSDAIAASLGWNRQQIEMLAEKFYGTPFRIMVKQGSIA